MNLTLVNGQATVSLSDRQEERLLAEAASAYATTKAREEVLSRAYDVPALCARLSIGESTAYALIRSGELRSTCVAKKGYRVSELAVREYLGDATAPP